MVLGQAATLSGSGALPESLAQQRARVARAERHAQRSGDRSGVDTVRRDYAAAKIADYVERIVESAPPLTTDQQARIAALLRGAA